MWRRNKKKAVSPPNISAASMDIQSERRRLLDAEGDNEDPTELVSEQDAYLRLVNTNTGLADQYGCCLSS